LTAAAPADKTKENEGTGSRYFLFIGNRLNGITGDTIREAGGAILLPGIACYT